MDATTLLVTVYCLVDEWLAGRRLRQRGPNPILADSEVLTIECVGEFWGIDTDKGLDEYFRRHLEPGHRPLRPAATGRPVRPGGAAHLGRRPLRQPASGVDRGPGRADHRLWAGWPRPHRHTRMRLAGVRLQFWAVPFPDLR